MLHISIHDRLLSSYGPATLKVRIWWTNKNADLQICRFADSQNSGEKRTTHQILIFMLTFVIAPFIRRQAYFLYFWLDFSTVKPTEPPAKTEDAKPEPEPKSEDKVEEMEQ